MMKNLILPIYLCFSFLACTEISRDEKAIRKMIGDLIAGDNRSDLEAVLFYYSPNATLMRPGKPSISGEEQIRLSYQNIFASTRLQLETSVEGVEVNRFSALAWGSNTGKAISLKDSSVREVNDKFLMHLVKAEGEWKIQRLIWNSNK